MELTIKVSNPVEAVALRNALAEGEHRSSDGYTSWGFTARTEITKRGQISVVIDVNSWEEYKVRLRVAAWQKNNAELNS